MKRILYFCMICFISAVFVFAAGLRAEIVRTLGDNYYHGKLSSATKEKVVFNELFEFPVKNLAELSFQQLPPVEDEVPPLIKETAGRYNELNAKAKLLENKYPDSEAVIIFSDGFYKLNPDGTWMLSYNVAAKIIRESASDKFKSLYDYFEEGRDSIIIRKASVYFPDGTVYPFQPANFKVINPQASEGFFAQSSGVEYTFPVVQAGAIVEYQVELKKEKPFRPDFFFPKWTIKAFYPVGSSSFSVKVPAGKKLYYSALNAGNNKEPKFIKLQDEWEYRWSFGEVKPVYEEPSMPNVLNFMPQVKGSLFDGWKEIYDWLAPLYKERTEPDELLIKKAKEICAKAKTQNEKIAALYHFVQRSIRYSAVKMGVTSTWAGYHAHITLERKYGCCLDKALLFGALLKAVGIESSPVLLDPSDLPAHDLAVPDIDFAHVITEVKMQDGKSLYLDSTSYDYRYPSMHALNYNVNAVSVSDRKNVNTGLPAKNEMRYVYDINISTKDAAFVVMDASFEGPAEGERRSYLSSISSAKRVSVFNNSIGAISADAHLAAHRIINLDDLDKPFSYGLKYALANYLVNAGDLAIFSLPELELSFPEVALKERKYPIAYSAPYTIISEYKIKFPPSLKIEALPEDTLMEDGYAVYSFNCTSAAQQLKCTQRVSLKACVVPVLAYGQYRSFLGKAVSLSREKIFFKRDKK